MEISQVHNTLCDLNWMSTIVVVRMYYIHIPVRSLFSDSLRIYPDSELIGEIIKPAFLFATRIYFNRVAGSLCIPNTRTCLCCTDREQTDREQTDNRLKESYCLRSRIFRANWLFEGEGRSKTHPQLSECLTTKKINSVTNRVIVNFLLLFTHCKRIKIAYPPHLLNPLLYSKCLILSN